MAFCEDCGALLDPGTEPSRCRECRSEVEGNGSESRSTESSNDDSLTAREARTKLERLQTTDSGAVRKKHAVRWLDGLDTPSDREVREAITPKPAGFSGSVYPTAISNVRVTGDPEFIETIAGRLKPFLEMEDHRYRLEINLQRTEDRESGELTDNYALYLTVTERG